MAPDQQHRTTAAARLGVSTSKRLGRTGSVERSAPAVAIAEKGVILIGCAPDL
jgi:hypothetical protein